NVQVSVCKELHDSESCKMWFYRSALPAGVWWNREQLPAVEGLWALSLKSAVPYLEKQLWDLLPDLPHPSAARPTALKLDDQRWCDLSEEVPPFPEPSQRTSPSPDLLQQDVSRPGSDPPDRQLSSHSRQSLDGRKTSLQTRNESPRPSLHSWEGAAAPAGLSGVGGEQGRKEEEPVGRQRESDNRASENQEEVMEVEEEVQRSVRGDGGPGGAVLESCPMCLMVFPAGFTQMDCDAHLAQCLSEVNVDVTW
ncbi:hypothetical protein L3Q82_015518, partial [Scortum barcoo]